MSTLVLRPWLLNGTLLSSPVRSKTYRIVTGGDKLGLFALAGSWALAFAWKLPLDSCTLRGKSPVRFRTYQIVTGEDMFEKPAIASQLALIVLLALAGA